ncbi:uncharacterized protein F5891DRAFT_1256816 [Suillus fuscotomentosus]|uniref:Uncharacterized protein n=1 Tax=Suillus fuscotomentosus TaxID=1912939 RepID=A0AAD4DVY6_9AGAM|nr:uncharacterized protein F5891DRAFT_1256816 [Suillus fuscotomentosus]KAG1893884.1 hypothetical protein F5891DRAFT_1256816 [Suillus fuscotomentosus]
MHWTSAQNSFKGISVTLVHQFQTATLAVLKQNNNSFKGISVMLVHWFQTTTLKQNNVHALDLRPDSPQFRQGISVMLVHRPGLENIQGLVANAGNFEFENTMVKDYFKKAWGCGSSIMVLWYPTVLTLVLMQVASDVIQKKPRRRKESAILKSALADIQKCKELGIEMHLQANKTRSSYADHVRRGCEWLASHFDAPSCSADKWDCSVPKDPLVQPVALSVPSFVRDNPDSDVYADPAFKDVFGCMPNRCSDKVLALFMSLKGFHKNLSKNMVESIRTAFKSSGSKHEQHPAGLHEAAFLLEIALQAIQLVMSGTLPSQVQLTLDTRTQLTRHLEQVTFDAGIWTLWSRCFELVKLQHKDISLDTILLDTVMKKYLAHEPLTLSDSNTYFEIFLLNQKGWQKRVDKGICEADLRSNHYKIFPRPDMPSCNSFIWMLLWIKWLEFFHYGRTLGPNNFIFPSMGANGIMQPGQPLSHDTVKKWIDEAMTGAGILGCFSTHCFHHGGAQYWFMFAPVGWADGEQRNTLICYLLDELHTYETDYSDALTPFSHKAESSLAGEQALMRPASTEELRMVHASVAADVNCLQVDVSTVNDSLWSLISMVQATSSCLKAAGHLPPTQLEEDPRFTLLSASSAESPQISTPQHVCPPATHSRPLSSVRRSHGHAHITPTTRPLPSAAAHTASTQQLPSNGLVIPRLPLVHSNGLKTPKAESWRDIITHWLIGDPNRGLKTPLKDWPQEWYQGPNWKLAMQYQNRAIVACKFINHYQSDEALFLAAYPEAEQGHTPLLAAINKAWAA